MAALGQQVLTVHNQARQSMVVVEVAVQAKKEFHDGVGMLMLKVATV